MKNKAVLWAIILLIIASSLLIFQPASKWLGIGSTGSENDPQENGVVATGVDQMPRLEKGGVSNSIKPSNISGTVVSSGDALAQKNKEIELNKWQERNGYRIPDQYNNYTIGQLEVMSAKGDMLATTQIGLLKLQDYNPVAAEPYFEKAVAQGSIFAAGQASLMYDPDGPIVASIKREAKNSSFEGDRLKAFLWAKIAADRGETDALVGVALHGKHYSAEERLRLEKLASLRFDVLSKQYESLNGTPFRKDAQPEWLPPDWDEAILQQVDKK